MSRNKISQRINWRLMIVTLCYLSGIAIFYFTIDNQEQGSTASYLANKPVLSQPQIQMQLPQTGTTKLASNHSKGSRGEVARGASLLNVQTVDAATPLCYNQSSMSTSVNNRVASGNRENMRVYTAIQHLPASQFQKQSGENENNNTVASTEANSTPFNDLRKDWGGGDGDEDPFEPGGDAEDPGSSVDTPIGSGWWFLLGCTGLYIFFIYKKQSSKI